MGVRCLIVKEEANGLLRYVYCHRGHSAERMGRTLSAHYAGEREVNALLNAGDIGDLYNHPDRQTIHNADHARSLPALWSRMAAAGILWAWVWRRSPGGAGQWEYHPPPVL